MIMKRLLILLAFLTSGLIHAQDTISSHRVGIYAYEHCVKIESDTFLITTCPDKAIDTKMSQRSRDTIQSYERFYQNGKRMWKGTLWNDQFVGELELYNEKGQLCAELFFDKGTVQRQKVHTKKSGIVFGKYTYSSTVYGGMMNEDGTSNVSHSEGPMRWKLMYTVQMNSNSDDQIKHSEFRTDSYGYYLLVLEEGNYGCYPSHYPIKNVDPSIGVPRETANSIEGNWNNTGLLVIKKGEFSYRPMHYSSTGYAP
jgi:hypothetical protein